MSSYLIDRQLEPYSLAMWSAAVDDIDAMWSVAGDRYHQPPIAETDHSTGAATAPQEEQNTFQYPWMKSRSGGKNNLK